ncbi:hypothetical protein [Promicromonospora panici]|uniref:hypothetical protein n=1 Tax=Promicromonospora panici TaxID=2219658 RepID=UPI00101C4853|nr:hypothetical protein [Promicromonospora panici]
MNENAENMGGGDNPEKKLSPIQEYSSPLAAAAVWMGLVGALMSLLAYIFSAPVWMVALTAILCVSGALTMGISSWKTSRKMGISAIRVAWNSFLSAFNFFMLFP